MKTKTISKANRRSVTLRLKPPVRSQQQSARCAAGLNLKSILVPIDFADPSKKALEYAVAMAEQFGARNLAAIRGGWEIASPPDLQAA